jgi:hypothetical protein
MANITMRFPRLLLQVQMVRRMSAIDAVDGSSTGT